MSNPDDDTDVPSGFNDNAEMERTSSRSSDTVTRASLRVRVIHIEPTHDLCGVGVKLKFCMTCSTRLLQHPLTPLLLRLWFT